MAAGPPWSKQLLQPQVEPFFRCQRWGAKFNKAWNVQLALACSPGRRNSYLASCYFSFCSLPKSRRKEPDWSLFLGLHPRAPEWSTEASNLVM